MIEVPVYNQAGDEVEKFQVDEAKLGGEVRRNLLKQAIVYYHANQRQGTVRTQARGEVAGSTRKMFRQKGTGNARTGGIRNPIKVKQLHKGLQQLGEEGAVQVFKPVNGGDLILGAVGVLQFDVVASRLQGEYGVDAMFEGTSTTSARWVTCDDKKMLADFEKALSNNVSYDAAGNMAYLAPNSVNLKLTQERWPKVVFHTTREHAVKL